jgi:uncharacterized membrane protein
MPQGHRDPGSTSFFVRFTLERKPMTAQTPPSIPRLSRSPWRKFDAHHRAAAGVVVGAATAWIMQGRVRAPLQALAAWDTFAGTVIILAWAVILTQDPYEMRRAAKLEDASRRFLFSVVLVAAGASLLAVLMTLGFAKDLPKSRLIEHVILSVSTVGLSWILVHTIFALRYAHIYYAGAKESPRTAVAGGLIFPEESNPDYSDFAYFSFVIGMTCQVSDVQISARPMRRTALWHGLIAFGFNTAILALLVNIVAGLL